MEHAKSLPRRQLPDLKPKTTISALAPQPEPAQAACPTQKSHFGVNIGYAPQQPHGSLQGPQAFYHRRQLRLP
jgi:hypothetical protein